MKKKRTISLDGLKRINNVLNVEQQRMVVGGVNITSVNLNGGGTTVSYKWEDGTTYTVVASPNGSVYWFDGVTVSSGSIVPNGAGCQFNGVIYTGSNGLSINEFIHEYGHYLQQMDMGTASYLLSVATESAYKSITDDPNYYSDGYEYDASARGNEYMDTYFPNSGYSAPTSP